MKIKILKCGKLRNIHKKCMKRKKNKRILKKIKSKRQDMNNFAIFLTSFFKRSEGFISFCVSSHGTEM